MPHDKVQTRETQIAAFVAKGGAMTNAARRFNTTVKEVRRICQALATPTSYAGKRQAQQNS